MLPENENCAECICKCFTLGKDLRAAMQPAGFLLWERRYWTYWLMRHKLILLFWTRNNKVTMSVEKKIVDCLCKSSYLREGFKGCNATWFVTYNQPLTRSWALAACILMLVNIRTKHRFSMLYKSNRLPSHITLGT